LNDTEPGAVGAECSCVGSFGFLAVVVLEGSLPFGYARVPGEGLAWPPGSRVSRRVFVLRLPSQSG